MNQQQLAFVCAFCLTRNGTRAAVMAGYSARTAAAAASRLRKRPEVSQAIAQLLKLASGNKKMTPLEYLLGVVRDEHASIPRRIRAATAAARYLHPRPSAGKKDQAQEAARKTGAGKFASAAPPLRLVPRKP